MAVLPAALPGAASAAVRDLLAGPARRGRVLGVHPACVYVRVDDEMVAVETADGLGLPCAVRLGVDRSFGCFRHVRHDDDAVVGDGLLRAGPVTVRVARWWPPRPPRPPAAGPPPAGRLAVVADLLAAHPVPVPVDAPFGELLGLGPGLTPAGDDVRAGLIVALHHHPRRRAPLAAAVTRLAPRRTTALSAALLRHAAAGRALPAVMDVADHLAGHGPSGDAERVVGRLLAVGSSSGAALAHGLLRGARTVTGGARPKEAVA
jgi:hypothetical protein